MLLLPLLAAVLANGDIECHTSQLAPLGQHWTGVIREGNETSCRNSACMLMWGLTEEGRVRILAQGCAAGESEPLVRGPPTMQNECPRGTMVGPPVDGPLLAGEDAIPILQSLTHVRVCMCTEEACNGAPIGDGEECNQTTPFCSMLMHDGEAEPRAHFWPREKREGEEEPVTSASVSGGGGGEGGGNVAEFVILAVVLLIVLAAVAALAFALGRKFLWLRKPDRLSQRYRHTSSRLNSIAQVTILTEVAQGYKLEAEEMVRESQAGGPHQIANWKYDEEVKLGTGSFGAVYRVDMRPDYLVDAKRAALKTFDHRRSTHFFNESRTLRYVHDFKHHPNIVAYLGRAVDCRDTLDEATWRIALELCEGGTLREWIRASPISLPQYLEAASGLLSALAFLHSEESVPTNFLSSFRGSSADSGHPDSRSNSRSRRSSKAGAPPMKKKYRIAHCDINSRNVLVRNAATGNVALADFGLALTDREKRQEEVQIREIGTIRYLAPEMLQSLINLSDTLNSLILVDTYATGLVLWEMLSRTAEMYGEGDAVPEYSPPYEAELAERGEATANRFEAMLNVVVRRSQRPRWGGRRAEWRRREDEAAARDEESDLNEEERFLLASAEGVDCMLARDPDARMTVPAMGEKVDSMRLRLLRARQRVSREDSMLDETSASC